MFQQGITVAKDYITYAAVTEREYSQDRSLFVEAKRATAILLLA